MTEQSQPIPRPHFIIDAGEESIELRIKAFEHDIVANPEQYALILSDLNEVATEGSLSPREAREADFAGMEVQGDAIARLVEFFKYRFDSHVSFDPDTEGSLEKDVAYREKLNKLSNAQAEKEKIRDEIRRLRFRHYVGRVITWREQNQNLDENNSGDELRSVS